MKKTGVLGVFRNFLAVAAVTAVLLSSCNDSNDSADGITRLTIWGSWTGTGMELFQQHIAKFNEENPGIVAKYVLQPEFEQKILTAIAGGDVPDVLLWDRFHTNVYAPRGALMPVDDLIARDNVDPGIFFSEAVKELQNGDKTYGLPLVVDTRALFYNRDIFREVGLDPDRPPQTWDELREYAVKLTKWEGGRMVRSGFALNDVGLFNVWILQAGGAMMNADMQTVAFNSAAGLTVLNFWDQLLNRDRVYVVGFNDGQAEGQHPLVTGRVAMMWDGPWSISTLARHAQDLDYGVAPLPAGPDGHRGAGMGGFGLTIANGSRNVDAAWEFVKWLTVNTSNNAEFAYITGNIPANLEAAQDPRFTDDPHFAGILENMQFATIRPQVNGYASMEGNASIPVLQMFLSGERTAEQALAEAEAKGNQILADNR